MLNLARINSRVNMKVHMYLAMKAYLLALAIDGGE
jgi:hypothetical protein